MDDTAHEKSFWSLVNTSLSLLGVEARESENLLAGLQAEFSSSSDLERALLLHLEPLAVAADLADTQVDTDHLLDDYFAARERLFDLPGEE